MALQKRIEMETGIILPEAYIRITEGMLSLDKGTAHIVVETYADVLARNNKKIPVVKTEHKADMRGGQPQIEAEYTLLLNDIVVGDGTNLVVVDLDGDGTADFELIEGTHLTTDGTFSTLTNVVVDGLNSHQNFMYDYVATRVDEGVINIKAKIDGVKAGSKGNKLDISGSMTQSFDLNIHGQDSIISSFEKFFGIQAMDVEGTNVFKQGYMFIKSLPEYQDSIDVI
jgi:hypothetical protein